MRTWSWRRRYGKVWIDCDGKRAALPAHGRDEDIEFIQFIVDALNAAEQQREDDAIDTTRYVYSKIPANKVRWEMDGNGALTSVEELP